MKQYEAITKEWATTATTEELNATLADIEYFEDDLKWADFLTYGEQMLKKTLFNNKCVINRELWNRTEA